MNKIQTVTYYMGAFLCLMTVGLLTACSDDSADSAVSKREIHLTAGGRQYHVDDAEMTSAPGLTRTVTYPSSDWTAITPSDNMLVFIAKPNDNATSSDVSSRLFRFSATKDWQANVTITDTNPEYLIYGFMPMDAENSSDEVSISRLPLGGSGYESNYKIGAQLTIRGLKVLTMSDPCVIVGVKKMEGKSSNVTLEWGKFGYTFQAESNTGNTDDYMSILLDHIYSRYYFKMKVAASYNTMRTIRITKMTLEALNLAGTQTVRSVDATVALRANTTNSNPVSSITFKRNEGTRVMTLYDKDAADNTIGGADGLTLTTDLQEIGFCLAPADQRGFQLTTDYEVLDTSGAVIRTDQVVNRFNTINFRDKKITSTTPGLKHYINITVNPTFIYTLSDSDIEFEINN